MGKHPYDKYYRKVLPALVSKVEEFKILNYGTMDIQTLWLYLTEKKWDKREEEPVISGLVADILSVKPGNYMNFIQVNAYKSRDWEVPFSDEDMTLLFEPPKNS